MPAEKVRLNLELSRALNDRLDEMARNSGSTMTDVVRQAFALLEFAHAGKLKGQHIGLTSDPEKLDTVVVGLL